MDHTSTSTPTKDEIKLLIANALLENNEKINAAIDQSAEKITRSVNESNGRFLNELLTLTANHEKLAGRVTNVENRVRYTWAKVIALTAAASIMGGGLGILIEALLLHSHN